MNLMGLQEDATISLNGSGTAFVVLSTKAARDALVHLSRSGFLAPLRWKGEAIQLTLREARCEAIDVNWVNFSSWRHFPGKIALGILLMLGTILLWICLYLPYAAFYVDLVVIPGLEPTSSQDLLLGFAIAVGNAVLAVVISKVTSWAGFKYKDSRDVAVLTLSFLGTLLNTLFDLAMVAMVSKGAMLEEAFAGKDTGYDTVVARE